MTDRLPHGGGRFLVVKQGVPLPSARGAHGQGEAGSTSTFKLIVWGTGSEVPSLLFDLRTAGSDKKQNKKQATANAQTQNTHAHAHPAGFCARSFFFCGLVAGTLTQA